LSLTLVDRGGGNNYRAIATVAGAVARTIATAVAGAIARTVATAVARTIATIAATIATVARVNNNGLAANNWCADRSATWLAEEIRGGG
jgi:hypothetical protein